MNRTTANGLRVGVTVALLAFLAWRLDISSLARTFHDIDPAWLVAALALTVPQVVVSAWRWQLTARRIGLRLPLPAAVREYYLATFLNQVLPGGVLGDASRAWRHARIEAPGPAAWHAVVIERTSGQLALVLVGIVALACAPALRAAVIGAIGGMTGTGMALSVLVIGAAAMAIALALCRAPALAPHLRRFAGNMRRSLLSASIWRAQLLSSLLVVATYIGVFLLCAQALALTKPVTDLWLLIPPVLMAMAIPLSIAGWGIREGAAALVWTLAGLPAHEGVALSLCYGAVVMISSLPGAAVLVWRGSQR